jgi:hypothetical protein
MEARAERFGLPAPTLEDVKRQLSGGILGRGFTENKHSTDVLSPHPPPHVYMSVHPYGEACS